MESLYLVVGLFYAVVIGDLLVSRIVEQLYQPLRWKKHPEKRPLAFSPRLVGILDRGLFFSSYFLGHVEFIAVWLAFKVAGTWGRWEKDVDEDDRIGKGDNEEKDFIAPGRYLYNTFLIGNGFSICFGVIGAEVVKLLNDGKCALSAIVSIGFILLAIVFLQLIRYFMKRDPVLGKRGYPK
jgi:hypothetical protein